MKVSDLLERIGKEEFYKQFKKEHPSSYLCALLCILTKSENEGDKIQLDFFMPDKKNIAFSEYPFNEMRFPEESINEFSKLNYRKMAFEIDELWEVVDKIKKEKEIQHNTQKIIGVLKENKWVLTCFNDSMSMLKIHLNSLTGQVEKLDKGALTDFIGFKKTV